MRLVIDEKDINKLIKKHKEELTTDNLKELEAIKVNIVQEQFFASKEEDKDMTMAKIKEMLSLYHKMGEFIEKKHPKKVYTGCLAQFNNIFLNHFRNILKSR